MTRRTWIPLAALLPLALLLSGCPAKYPKCDSDKQCREHGEVCVNGACQECGRDTDCKAGFVCQETRCVPKAECTSDAACAAGQKCRAGRCQAECEKTTDCASGLECKSGRCLASEMCLTDNDCSGGRKCQANRCADVGPDCSLPTVHFAFNEYALTAEGQQLLDNTADCIKKGKIPAAITLAGHGDERGTEEYNLHLGERRANAVKRYLATLGVDGAKLKTISFGEERPADPGHDEAAWAKNRRVELTP